LHDDDSQRQEYDRCHANKIADALDGEGIVSVHTCSQCGATWEGYLPLEDEDTVS
jgi:hypothetical protein